MHSVYRVSVAGAFPPRALRYSVLADGARVGYGAPAADARSVVAVTTDPAVLTGRITVRYGSGHERAVAPAGASSAPSTAAAPSAAAGPHAVTRAVYDLGDQAYQPPGLSGKVELAGDVHYPTDLGNGPYPLVLFLHGNHAELLQRERRRLPLAVRLGLAADPQLRGIRLHRPAPGQLRVRRRVRQRQRRQRPGQPGR